MIKIKIYKNEEELMYFILDQFITTHGINESKNIYDKELKLSKRLIDDLNKARRGKDENILSTSV